MVRAARMRPSGRRPDDVPDDRHACAARRASQLLSDPSRAHAAGKLVMRTMQSDPPRPAAADAHVLQPDGMAGTEDTALTGHSGTLQEHSPGRQRPRTTGRTFPFAGRTDPGGTPPPETGSTPASHRACGPPPNPRCRAGDGGNHMIAFIRRALRRREAVRTEAGGARAAAPAGSGGDRLGPRVQRRSVRRRPAPLVGRG